MKDVVIDGYSLLYSFFKNRKRRLVETYDTNYIVTEVNKILDDLEHCNLRVVKVFFTCVKDSEKIPILVERRRARNMKSRKFWDGTLLDSMNIIISL